MQLCGSLSILWHCVSLGLEWKLTFSSPVATVEFSKFAGILSAALSHYHLSGFEIVQLEFHHLHELCSVMFPKAHLTSHSRMSVSRWVITPSWLSVCSCHLFLISSASVRSIHFCPLSSPSLHEMFPWYLSFSWRDLYSFPFCCFPLFLGLLLLLSCFSRVQFCATPQTAAHQALPSLGFSRQEYWSELPFPSPMHESEKWK